MDVSVDVSVAGPKWVRARCKVLADTWECHANNLTLSNASVGPLPEAVGTCRWRVTSHIRPTLRSSSAVNLEQRVRVRLTVES